MKKITLCLMMFSPLTLPFAVAEEKVESVKQVSVVGKAVQTELQTLYLALKKSADKQDVKANTSQKKLTAGLEGYNRQLNAVYTEADQKASVSHDKWVGLNASLKEIKELSSLNAVAFDRVLKKDLTSWIVDAQSFGKSVEKYAVLTKSDTNTAITYNIGGNRNVNSGLVVEDFSLGLDTPADRIALVERLTRIRADENRIFARGGFTTTGGVPRNFPSAYIYGNGSFGNTTTLGRRDTLIPLTSRNRQIERRRTTPRYNFTVK